MKRNDLRSSNQLHDLLEGTQAVVFAVVTNKDERDQWMQQSLIKFLYRRLSKADKGIVYRDNEAADRLRSAQKQLFFQSTSCNELKLKEK